MTREIERGRTVEATLRATTYGTEAQARASAERWRRNLAVELQQDVELVSVELEDVDGAEDPYASVQSRGSWVVCCRECDRGDPTPLPFAQKVERETWVLTHRDETGHAEYVRVDPEEGGSVEWSGTIAYERVPTTDGRIIEHLSWPGLVSGPLPVFLEGNPQEQVGTIESAWREEFVDTKGGGTRVRARGTILPSVVGEDGHALLGIDVDQDMADAYDHGRLLVVRSRLRSVTLYRETEPAQAAWDDVGLEIET